MLPTLRRASGSTEIHIEIQEEETSTAIALRTGDYEVISGMFPTARKWALVVPPDEPKFGERLGEEPWVAELSGLYEVSGLHKASTFCAPDEEPPADAPMELSLSECLVLEELSAPAVPFVPEPTLLPPPPAPAPLPVVAEPLGLTFDEMEATTPGLGLEVLAWGILLAASGVVAYGASVGCLEPWIATLGRIARISPVDLIALLRFGGFE